MLSETRPAKVGRWSEPALRVLRERYSPGQGGEVVETPEEMCWRVALTIAGAEARFGRSAAAVREIAAAFYDMMVEGHFLPNSPTLMNAGKDNRLQYSACYVLPVGDSMDGDLRLRQGGRDHPPVGRRDGVLVLAAPPQGRHRRARPAAGRRARCPFCASSTRATEAVKQGGTRRGANMGILRVDHPDILEFIECKLDGGITNFNISVAVTDAFMDALEAGRSTTRSTRAPARSPGAAVRRARSSTASFEAAWRTGDPGHGLHRPDQREPRESHAGGRARSRRRIRAGSSRSCRTRRAISARSTSRGSPGGAATGEWTVDWDEMERVVRLAVRFLDDVIEVNPYPLPEIDADREGQPPDRPRHHGLGRSPVHDRASRTTARRRSTSADRLMAFVERDGARPVGASSPRSAGRSRTGAARSTATGGRSGTRR